MLTTDKWAELQKQDRFAGHQAITADQYKTPEQQAWWQGVQHVGEQQGGTLWGAVGEGEMPGLPVGGQFGGVNQTEQFGGTTPTGIGATSMQDLLGAGVSQETQDAEANWLAIQQGYNQPVNEDDIREKTLAQFQEQIDSLNQAYGEEKRRLTQQGLGRLGQSGAIQARRGLLGSDFGAAQTATVENANEDVMRAAEAQHQLKLASIYGQVNQEVKDEANAKRAAREQGASNLLEYYKGVDERKNTRIGATATNLLNLGLDPSDEEIAELAKQLGTTPAILKGEYNRQKAEAMPETENVKGMEVDGSIINPYTGEVIYQGAGETTEPITQKIGDTLLQYNSETGGWDNVYTAADGTTTLDGSPVKPKELTQAQHKMKLYGDRMESADVIIQELGREFVGNLDVFGKLLPNVMKGDDRQRYEQAQRNFVNAILRQESGAAIAPDEFKSATQQYFPQPGDGEDVIKQKLANREQVIQGFRDAAGQTEITEETGTPSEDDPLGLGFSQVGGDTNSAILDKIGKETGSGGQCGRFVNKHTGLGLGDTYASKMAKMDKSITTPEPGMVFLMPHKWTGHTGFIVGVDGDEAIVKDSNWDLNEKIKTHRIPLNQITGLARV